MKSEAVWVGTLAEAGFASLTRDQASSLGGLPMHVPQAFWQLVAIREPIWIQIIEDEWLRLKQHGPLTIRIFSRTALAELEVQSWRGMADRAQAKIEFVTDETLREPTLYDESKRYFAITSAQVDELTWRREIEAYQQSLDPLMVSLDSFRYWPGFLKSRRSEFADSVAREFARAQVETSPQEDHRGEGHLLLVNPTLQVINGEAFWRVDGQVNDCRLSWPQAAVIDELRENPRTPANVATAQLQAKGFPFKTRPNFTETIEGMIADGLLLKRA